MIKVVGMIIQLSAHRYRVDWYPTPSRYTNPFNNSPIQILEGIKLFFFMGYPYTTYIFNFSVPFLVCPKNILYHYFTFLFSLSITIALSPFFRIEWLNKFHLLFCFLQIFKSIPLRKIAHCKQSAILLKILNPQEVDNLTSGLFGNIYSIFPTAPGADQDTALN